MKRIKILIAFLALFASSEAQLLTGQFTRSSAKTQIQAMKVDSLFKMPSDTFKIRSQDSLAMAFKPVDGCLYVYTKGKWTKFGCIVVPPTNNIFITTQPQSQTVTQGGTVTLSVSVSNWVQGWTAEWTKNGGAQINQNDLVTNSTSLTVPAADGDSWVVRVINPAGDFATSSPAIVNTVMLFAFTEHPASKQVGYGVGFNLNAKVQGGSAGTTYKWSWYSVGSSTPLSVVTTTLPEVSQAFGGITSPVDFYVVAKDNNSAQEITSNVANVTVVANPTITFGYNTSDPYIDNTTVPVINAQSSFTIQHNADISINPPSYMVDQFLILKVPASEPIITKWFNTSFNNGDIPDFAWREPFVVGGFRYYVTRNAAGFAFDPTTPIKFTHP